MMTRNTKIPASQWAVAALFAVLSLVTLYLFVHVAEPPQRQPGIKFKQNYTEDALQKALTEAGLQTRLAEIQRASTPVGSREIGRMPGTLGFRNTAALIKSTFTEICGDDNVKTQQFQVVVPVTEYCEILDAKGKPLPGVTLYPFEPNGMATTVLPEQGITGPLVIVKSKAPLDLVEKPLENSIVLNEGLDGSWPMMASMGAQAVIVKEDAIKQGDPDTPAPWTTMATPYDQPYPRFLVRGPIEKFANQPLTIRCKVTWQSESAQNILGVLRAEGQDKEPEALIITSYYDSYSLVPDVAPGGEQAISLAVMLELAKALAPYRATMKRDVIFAATAGHAQTLEGAIRLNQAIEGFTKEFKDHKSFESLRAAHARKADYAKIALDEIIGAEEPWRIDDGKHKADHPKNKGNVAYREQWLQRPKEFRKWFEQCFATVAGEVNLDRRDDFLDARLTWIRAGQPNFREGFDAENASSNERSMAKNRDPLMNAYLAAKAEDNTSGNVITTPFWMVAFNLRPASAGARDRFEEWQYLRKAEAYLERIHAYHTQQMAEIDDSIALRDLFKSYQKTLTVNLELYSGGAQSMRDLSVLMGRKIPGTVVEPQSTDLRNAIDEKVPQNGTDKLFKVSSWGSKDAEGGTNDPNNHSQTLTELESEVWFRCARQAFTVINKTFYPNKIGTPEDTFEGLSTAVLRDQLTPIGKAMLAIAHGKIGFKKIQYIPGNDSIVTFRGTVYASAGVSGAVPNHRVGENTYVHYYQIFGPAALSRGIRICPIISVNPYGEYYRQFNFDMSLWGQPVAVDAARFDDRGHIAYYKDASPKSQSIFKNETFPSSDLAIGNEKPINLQLFRASQVVCYQRGNPKSLNSFAGFNFIQKQGMQAPERSHPEIALGAPGVSAFLDPDCVFYIAMLDGSAANPEVQTFRAFMLNNLAETDAEALKVSTPEKNTLNPKDAADGELVGKGYLAAGWTPSAMPYLNLTFPYFDAAASMIRTHGIRLAKENQYFRADALMLKSQDDA
jgi:hypothetical protein